MVEKKQAASMKVWRKMPAEEIHRRIFSGLAQNVDFARTNILGVPASYLDAKVFYQDAPFLRDAPFLSTLIHNPNHIGCHTLGESERFFAGTQDLERELIKLCAEDIFRGGPDAQDGYVASGGTEANIQAIWIYRNLFMREYGARPDQIALLCSEDSHYSMVKAANLLQLPLRRIRVEAESRQVDPSHLRESVAGLQQQGVKFFIVVVNMMTTMFGSVDSVGRYSEILDAAGAYYRIHVDAAYGGFVYPFIAPDHHLHFGNPQISSITLDAHKMVQAPYGTGIFLARKGLMKYVFTEEASYIQGLDATLIGSRSGANAVAVWMILMTYGPYGWKEKILLLQYRTQWLCEQLLAIGIRFYRHPFANIVTIHSSEIDPDLAFRYGLVPDNHHQPQWYKIVLMDHVTIDKLEPFLTEMRLK